MDDRYLYLIYNIKNGKLYVGITNNPKVRWKRHISTAHSVSDKVKKSAIHFAIKKWGENNFIFKKIETYPDLHTACEKEIEWIKLLKDLKYQLYNETDGGEGVIGREITEEERKQRSKRMKGEKNYFYGKKLYGPANGHYGHKMKPHVKKILRKHMCKLTDDQVKEIRKLYATKRYTQTKLSEMFNVSLTQIHKIVNNKQWNGGPQITAPLTKPNLTKEIAQEIINKYKTGNYKQAELCQEYNLSPAQVSRIISGKRWPELQR